MVGLVETIRKLGPGAKAAFAYKLGFTFGEEVATLEAAVAPTAETTDVTERMRV